MSYVLEAGDADGAANLLVANVGGLIKLTGVAPALAYFTRVLAVGPCGTSAPSADLAITLPQTS